MPQKRPPKRLGDVSHLFISKSGTDEKPSGRLGEAVIWIAVMDRSLNRAHLASGIGAAFVRLGMKCTLLEFGEGLPNVGYYFSCKPDDYLAPTLEESRVVAGWIDSTFRYLYSTGPWNIKLFQQGFAASGSAHVVVVAFDYPFGSPDEDLFSELNRCSTRLLGREDGLDGCPDGVMVFADGKSADRRARFIFSFRNLNREGVVFLADLSGAAEPDGAVDQRIIIPVELRCSWGRRMPPAEPFFTDLDSSFLQFLSYRRRMAREK